MASTTQCPYCGAVLLKEDLFCGECGAPNPLAADGAAPPPAPTVPPPAPAALSPPPPPPPPPPPSRAPSAPPSASTGKGWQVAWLSLVALGVAVCLFGLIVFVLLGSLPSETVTPQEGWLYSATCCLLPIGGVGIALMILGLIIRYIKSQRR